MPKGNRIGKPDVNQMASNLIDAISRELPAEQPESGKIRLRLRSADWAV